MKRLRHVLVREFIHPSLVKIFIYHLVMKNRQEEKYLLVSKIISKRNRSKVLFSIISVECIKNSFLKLFFSWLRHTAPPRELPRRNTEKIMDFKRLEYFCSLVEFGSFSKAATSLHISQPPLSQRIKELEEELERSIEALPEECRVVFKKVVLNKKIRRNSPRAEYLC